MRVPGRLACARCDGGGCESCNRSGAFKVPSGVDSVEVVLAPGEGPVRLRLERPFGDDAGIDQLLVDLLPIEAPVADGSLVIRRPEPLPVVAKRSAPSPATTVTLVGALVGFLLLVVLSLTQRCGH